MRPTSLQERAESLQKLAGTIMGCVLCHLSTSRVLAVPGEGPTDSKIMFIGEGPGRQEDKQGRPFVGPAGKFLDKCIKSIGLRREEVFIANVVKCRPIGFGVFEREICFYCKRCEESYPDVFKPMGGKPEKSRGKCCNGFERADKEVVAKRTAWLRDRGYADRDRKPNEIEIGACIHYLDQQIELVKPEIICTLGDTATTMVFKRFGLKPEGISKIHGKVFQADKIRIVPMYHPAAALYTAKLKELIQEDFKKLAEIVEGT